MQRVQETNNFIFSAPCVVCEHQLEIHFSTFIRECSFGEISLMNIIVYPKNAPSLSNVVTLIEMSGYCWKRKQAELQAEALSGYTMLNSLLKIL